MEKKKIQGALLRIERLRQNKGQKEVCYGICVPSYLSKIEHGTVTPDEKIVSELFAKLGIVYNVDEVWQTKQQSNIDKYFECLSYGLDTQEVYQELEQQASMLMYSKFVIDWLLIKGFEDESVLEEVAVLEDNMTSRQRAYYYILKGKNPVDKEESVRLCTKAFEILGDCFSLTRLCDGYLLQGNYAAIHGMENRFTALALEEGNTYYLARYFFTKGTAYACLSMDEMMMTYYKKGMHLLQNTGWANELSFFYYNIGATYISLKKYDLALEYLDKAPDAILALHKKAIAAIRKGDIDAGNRYLSKMKSQMQQDTKNREVNELRYQEALMECEADYLDKPEYLELLEKLIGVLKRDYHLGHIYFYKDVVLEAYKRQRKYKKALEFECELSSKTVKGRF